MAWVRICVLHTRNGGMKNGACFGKKTGQGCIQTNPNNQAAQANTAVQVAWLHPGQENRQPGAGVPVSRSFLEFA